MKAIIKFCFSMLAGLALHQTASITHKMPEGWEQLSGTTIGVLGAFPVIRMWHKEFHEIQNQDSRLTGAYLVGFLGVGSGVALGWLLDLLFGIDRE
jgi:hypothetical protein